MKPFLNSGAKIQLTPDGGWNWEGWDGTLEVEALPNPVKISKKHIIRDNDMPAFAMSFTKAGPKMYKATGFMDTPGTIVMSNFTVDGGTPDDKVNVSGGYGLLISSTGKFTCNYLVPSTKVTPGGPVPDPVPAKTGTWKVIDTNQELVFRYIVEFGILDGIQLGLDILGLLPIPFLGEIADGINALISLGRKDYAGAALNAAAMIPVVGIAASTIGLAKGVKKLEKALDAAKYVNKAKKSTKTITTPKGWITKSSKKGGGTVFQDPQNPHNSIRQMPGNPNSPHAAQQNPYVIFKKNGVTYDAQGNALKTAKDPAAHIPLNRFDINKMPNFE